MKLSISKISMLILLLASVFMSGCGEPKPYSVPRDRFHPIYNTDPYNHVHPWFPDS